MKTIPLRRGFTEIAPFYDLCFDADGRRRAVICGGYARYCASPKPTPRVVPADDCDLFPLDETASEQIKQALEAVGYEVRHENHVSITMKPTNEKADELAYLPTPQIIKPVVEGRIVTTGSMEEILENFDFTIVRAAIISATEVMVDEDFEEDEAHGVLRLKNIHCPVSSLLRCCKYARKGYFLRPAQALKLFIDWNERGWEYQSRIIDLFTHSALGAQSEENPDGMTQEEIDELEALLRID
jgi:hypothetical protein